MKKLIAGIALFVSSFSVMSKQLVDITVECIDTPAVMKYLQVSKAKLIAYVDIETVSGGTATDYVVEVDGKLVFIREAHSENMSCVLGEVPLKGKGKGNV